jgi:hypothetical protein
MVKKVELVKHKTATRAHLTNMEEAGYEDAFTRVFKGRRVFELLANCIFKDNFFLSMIY